MRLAGKTALVTGEEQASAPAARWRSAQEGCRVVISGRREDKLREAAAQFPGQPPMLTRVADVGDRNSATALVEWAQKELGRIDILINCAGINTPNA